MKGWHQEPERHSLAARGIKTGSIPVGKARGTSRPPMATAIEIAQNYIDSIETLFPDLNDERAWQWANDRRRFEGFLMFMYDYQFSDKDITDLQGVVMDMFRETKSEMTR